MSSVTPSLSITTASPSSQAKVVFSASTSSRMPIGTVRDRILKMRSPRLTNEGAAPLLKNVPRPVKQSSANRSTVVNPSSRSVRAIAESSSSAAVTSLPAASIFSRKSAAFALFAAAARPLPMPSLTTA